MRIERKRDDGYKVWMNRDEYQKLINCTGSLKEEIALRLMGDCGLRIGEVGDVAYSHTKRMPDGSGYKLRVVHGKDTTGELDEGKFRETWLPDDLERWLYRFKEEDDLSDEDELITVTRRTLNNWVDYAAEDAAEKTRDDDYLKLSSHDLRRQWAQYLLVEKRINPRVVMSLGGWSSYDAIEPYLNAPTDNHISEEMAGVL